MTCHHRLLFWGIWGALALIAAAIYYRFDSNADFLGIVETRTHKLGAQESGKISKIHVALGDVVKPGQVLAELDTADLDIKLAWIEAELERLNGQLEADRGRYKLEYARLLVQSDAGTAGLEARRAELLAKQAELQAVNDEIARLEKAQQEGLGRSRDLSELLIRRDSLTRYIQAGQSQLGALPRPARAATDEKQVVTSMLARALERIAELNRDKNEIEASRTRRQVVTPSAGRVVNLNYLPGDAVAAFTTILTVEEADAVYIDVYIPETSDQLPTLGARVQVFPHRAGVASAQGTITFVDPGYAAIPERLAFRKVIYWARKFRVKLDQGHGLMPGEAARVQVSAQTAPVPVAENTKP